MHMVGIHASSSSYVCMLCYYIYLYLNQSHQELYITLGCQSIISRSHTYLHACLFEYVQGLQ